MKFYADTKPPRTCFECKFIDCNLPRRRGVLNAEYTKCRHEDCPLKPITKSQTVKNMGRVLTDTLQGLKRTCNHCQVNDCEVCWSNDICNQIINLFAEVRGTNEE